MFKTAQKFKTFLESLKRIDNPHNPILEAIRKEYKILIEASDNNTIPINVWDDYWDDEHVPQGKIQSTWIYVEDSEIPPEDKKKYIIYFT